MRILIVTTRSNMFLEAFLRAYHREGGPKIENIVFMPDRSLLAEPQGRRIRFALRVFGIRGVLIVLLYRKCRRLLLSAKFRASGLRHTLNATLEQLGIHHTYCNGRRALNQAIAETDLLVSVGAPVIFKEDTLRIPKCGCLNVHNGNVPFYRGHFSTFWEILNDEPTTVTSIHEMAPKVDSGAVYSRSEFDWRTSDSLLDVVLAKKELGGKALAVLLKQLSRTTNQSFDELERLSDDPTRPSNYYGFPTLEDARLFPF